MRFGMRWRAWWQQSVRPLQWCSWIIKRGRRYRTSHPRGLSRCPRFGSRLHSRSQYCLVLPRAETGRWSLLRGQFGLSWTMTWSRTKLVGELLGAYRTIRMQVECRGTITNYNPPPLSARFGPRYSRGAFHDERPPLYWRADALRNAEPILVTKFGAGMASFRAEVINSLRFDLQSSSFRCRGY